MIRIIRHDDANGLMRCSSVLKRAGGVRSGFDEARWSIIDDVRDAGDEALIDYTARFDGVELTAELRIDEQTLASSAEKCDTRVVAALRSN